MARAATLLLLATACSDYGLEGIGPDGAGGDAVDEPVSDGDPADPDDDGGDPDDPVDEDDPDEVEGYDRPDDIDCTGVVFETGQWWGSMPFDGADGPTDDAGRPWYAYDYTMRDYSTVALPDQNIPVGYDKVYRVEVWLDEVPPDISLDMESDDGIWVYVNGVEIGHWGGDWQQEGCVNEATRCTDWRKVPPPPVTHVVGPGLNVIAARVSNAVDHSWFSIVPICVEE